MSGPKLCVAALLTNGDRVALIRSAKSGRAWEIPGGKVEPGETWRDALSREIRQEVGLDVAPSAWTVVDVLTGKPVEGAPFASTIIVARASAAGELVAGSDAAEAAWFDRRRGGLPIDLSPLQTRDVLFAWSAEQPPKYVTAEDLNEIERLDSEATPGPWIEGDLEAEDDSTVYDGSDGQRGAVAVCCLSAEDPAFIALARTLAPRLAAEVRAHRSDRGHLLAALARAEQTIEERDKRIAGLRQIVNDAAGVCEERNQLRASTAMLRRALVRATGCAEDAPAAVLLAGAEEQASVRETVQRLCQRWVDLDAGQTHRDLWATLNDLGRVHARLAAFGRAWTAEIDVEAEVEREAAEISFAYRLATCHPDSLWKPKPETWWTHECDEKERERWRAIFRRFVERNAKLIREVRRLEQEASARPALEHVKAAVDALRTAWDEQGRPRGFDLPLAAVERALASVEATIEARAEPTSTGCDDGHSGCSVCDRANVADEDAATRVGRMVGAQRGRLRDPESLRAIVEEAARESHGDVVLQALHVAGGAAAVEAIESPNDERE